MRMNNEPLRITEIVDEAKDVKTFFFDKNVHARPGRFVQAWIPDYGKKPYSISYDEPFGITVKRMKTDPKNPMAGRFTNRAFELKEGDYIWFDGPSGKGFPIESFNNREVCLVGGGTGIIPLANLSEKIRESEVMSFLGAKTVDELIMEERFENPVIATDDGSYGNEGLVTDVLMMYDRYLGRLDNRTKAAICGPEKMMYKAADILEHYIPAENIYISVERLMKCGIGLCGACDFGGYRPCVDGPVFTYKEIKDVPEIKGVSDFGKFKRDRCGRKEML